MKEGQYIVRGWYAKHCEIVMLEFEELICHINNCKQLSSLIIWGGSLSRRHNSMNTWMSLLPVLLVSIPRRDRQVDGVDLLRNFDVVACEHRGINSTKGVRDRHPAFIARMELRRAFLSSANACNSPNISAPPIEKSKDMCDHVPSPPGVLPHTTSSRFSSRLASSL